MSEIDASRFTAVALSPAAASFCNNHLWYHQHPDDGARLVAADILKRNVALPHLGLAAYHWYPREGTANMMVIGFFCPEISAYEAEIGVFKKKSMLSLATPERFVEACKKDWDAYCAWFKELGDTIDPPEYPYTVEYAKDLLAQEEALED